MNELLKDIVYTIKIMCDNELEEDAILNMFFAKFGSVVACKDILTDSSRHVKPLPIAYYALNFLPSGGNKTKPYKIISGFYDWLNEEYKNKNELNKISYIEEKLFNLDEKAKKTKLKELEKETENIFCIGQNTNGATAQRLYLTAQAIKYMGFGSLFFYDTEFLEKFEKLNQKGNYDNVLNLIYNLYDGDLDTVSTALTNRTETTGISCSVCFASAYSKLMRDFKLFNRFKEYLCNGFARRIFLYVASENNNANIRVVLPDTDDIYKAKNKIPLIINRLKEIYNNVIYKGIYKFDRGADKLINDYHKSLKNEVSSKFSFAETLPLEDEILKVELENSTWKIIKLSFILHLIENPSDLTVGESSVKAAIDYYKRMSGYLNLLLSKKALDEDDRLFIYINKNLNKQININNEFKKLFDNSTKHNWKKFKTESLPDMLDGLQANNIYYCKEKQGKKEYIKFYRKEETVDDLKEL
jgi:hypothetical protein